MLRGFTVFFAMCLLGVLGYYLFLDQLKPTDLEQVYQQKINQFLIKRLGSKNVDSIVFLEMSPTQNQVVIETITPQKMATKKTIIGSNKAQKPVSIQSKSK